MVVYLRLDKFTCISIVNLIHGTDYTTSFVQSITWQVKNIDTVWCSYNTVNFLQIPHKGHLIACPLGWDMGCLLCIYALFYILPQSLQWCVQYWVILGVPLLIQLVLDIHGPHIIQTPTRIYSDSLHEYYDWSLLIPHPDSIQIISLPGSELSQFMAVICTGLT